MAFSPDGLWLATGAMDGSVNVWDPLGGKIVWNVGRHQSYVYTLGFGRDIRSLVSGGSDGLCYLWDLRPPGAGADDDLARLWHDLVGEDSSAAYEATFALLASPDRAASMLAENLRAVKTVVDLDRVAEGSSDEEAQRRRRLTTLLVEKDPKVKLAIGVRRAVSLLAQIGTPDAIESLKELAKQGATTEMGRLATAALGRLRPRQGGDGRDCDPTRRSPLPDIGTCFCRRKTSCREAFLKFDRSHDVRRKNTIPIRHHIRIASVCLVSACQNRGADADFLHDWLSKAIRRVDEDLIRDAPLPRQSRVAQS